MQHTEKGGTIMIDYEKLDKLMELPVSEEMIGAYLEGNLNEFESDNVRCLMSQHKEFLDISLENGFDSDIDAAEVDFENIQLPFFAVADSFNNDTISLDLDDLPNTNTINELNDMKLEAAPRIFGEGGNGSNPIFDPMINQGPEGVCAIRSQQIILRDYGIDVSLEELKQFAIQNG